jgi:hypothetical protein
LPIFLSHIAVYSRAGLLDREQAAVYIKECINAFKEIETIDETAFCQYFGMEILHRAMGKRVPGIEKMDQKLALTELGLKIFDKNIDSIANLMEVI